MATNQVDTNPEPAVFTLHNEDSPSVVNDVESIVCSKEEIDTSVSESKTSELPITSQNPVYSDNVREEIAVKLSSGLLEECQPELEKAKSSLSELTNNQRILIETIVQENDKFKDCQAFTDVTETMEQVKHYHQKLVNVRREMSLLQEKSARLKKRALRIQQQKQRDALQKEQDRERAHERERHLEAKVKTVHNSKPT